MAIEYFFRNIRYGIFNIEYSIWNIFICFIDYRLTFFFSSAVNGHLASFQIFQTNYSRRNDLWLTWPKWPRELIITAKESDVGVWEMVYRLARKLSWSTKHYPSPWFLNPWFVSWRVLYRVLCYPSESSSFALPPYLPFSKYSEIFRNIPLLSCALANARSIS